MIWFAAVIRFATVQVSGFRVQGLGWWIFRTPRGVEQAGTARIQLVAAFFKGCLGFSELKKEPTLADRPLSRSALLILGHDVPTPQDYSFFCIDAHALHR